MGAAISRSVLTVRLSTFCGEDQPNVDAICGLVINADPVVSELIRQLLGQSDGPEVRLEHSATLDDGLQRLAAGGIDLVFLNANVFGNNGLKSFLSVVERAPDLPIAVWSNDNNDEMPLHFVQVSAQETLHKGQLHGRPICQCIREAIERFQVKEESRILLSRDPVTELPNRTAFMSHLKTAHCDALRGVRNFVVLFLNLDGFKSVNESLGHNIGDRLLVEVSRRLHKAMREDDFVSRFGADEFTILSHKGDDRRGIKSIAQRLQRCLDNPFEIGGEHLMFSASIGVAIYSTEYKQPDEIVRDPNTALHRAKALGKARHQVFDAFMRQHAIVRLGLEGDLRRTVDGEDLELHYQPFVCLRTERIVGFETLIR